MSALTLLNFTFLIVRRLVPIMYDICYENAERYICVICKLIRVFSLGDVYTVTVSY